MSPAGGRTRRASAPQAGLALDPFAHPTTHALIAAALAEDVGRGDVTTTATVPEATRGAAALVAREECVVAGLPLVEMVLAAVCAGREPTPRVELRVRDGERVAARAQLASIEGRLGAILTGERLLLNLVQQLSGVATLTRRFVDAIAGTRAAILDTRKTVPGMRLLQKYAVRCGGGRNHRFGLDDGVLIKDNHIAACGSLAAAVTHARARAPHGLRVEVECESMAQVKEALGAGADAILLDNMSPSEARAACEEIGGRALIEISGGVALQTVRALAETGADFISVGRLTHSAPSIDIGLDFAPVGGPRRRATPLEA